MRNKLLIGSLIGVFIIIVVVLIGMEGGLSTPQPLTENRDIPVYIEDTEESIEEPSNDEVPEEAADYILLKNWDGTGIKSTEPFTINKQPWYIIWTNEPEIMDGSPIGILQVTVYESSQPDLPIAFAANSMEATTDTSYVYQTGTFHLDINAANTEWEVSVFSQN